MMKIVCINKDAWKYLTEGKAYDVIKFNKKYGNYLIISDNGDDMWFPKKFFKPLSEYRIEKINKLLE